MIAWMRRNRPPAMPALDMAPGRPWGPAAERRAAGRLAGQRIDCIATLEQLLEAGDAFCQGCGRHRQTHRTQRKAMSR